jgi:hypothetical protein
MEAYWGSGGKASRILDRGTGVLRLCTEDVENDRKLVFISSLIIVCAVQEPGSIDGRSVPSSNASVSTVTCYTNTRHHYQPNTYGGAGRCAAQDNSC